MKRILFILALYSTLFYMTFISTLASVGAVCRSVSVAIFVVLSILALYSHFKSRVRLPKEIKLLLLSLFVSFISFGCYKILGCVYLFSDIRELLIPIMILFSAYIVFDVSEHELRKTIILFGVVAAICSVYIVLNTGGFVVEQQYRDVAKNQIAPFFAQIALVILYYFIKEEKTRYKILLLMSFICIISLPLFLRARTSLLCVFVGSIILLFREYKRRVFIYLPFVFILLYLCFGDTIFEIINASMFANYDTSDIDSITTGRYGRIEQSLKSIGRNLFFGASMNYIDQGIVFSDSYAPVHVYVLLKVLRYGIFGGISFIMAYCCVLYCGWKSYKMNHTVVFLCLLVAILTSLMEYSSPFGPSTSYVLCYMLLGRQLRIVQADGQNRVVSQYA